jgi:hypothetical protein
VTRRDPVSEDAHLQHDPLLIVRYVADDVHPDEVETARTRLSTCDACAELARDLRALTSATVAVPAPPRTRDFRLTPEQARSARPSGWRRLFGGMAGPRIGVLQPLSSAAIAIGLVLVVIGSGAVPWLSTSEERATQPDRTAQTERAQPAPTQGAVAGAAPTVIPDASPLSIEQGSPAPIPGFSHVDASARPESTAAAGTQYGAPASPGGAEVAPGPRAGELSTPVPDDASRETAGPVGTEIPRIAAMPTAAAEVTDAPAAAQGADDRREDADAAGASGTDDALILAGIALGSVGLLVLVLTVFGRRFAVRR